MYPTPPINWIPSDAIQLRRCTPIYEEVPGWQEPIHNTNSFGGLPENTKGFINRLEELLNTQINLIGIGPDREQIIKRREFSYA